MDLLGPASMVLRDLRHDRVRRQALQHDARLQLIGPATPSRRARKQLHAPRRTPPWVVRSVVRLEHCPLHRSVRKRSRPTTLQAIKGPHGTAYVHLLAILRACGAVEEPRKPQRRIEAQDRLCRPGSALPVCTGSS